MRDIVVTIPAARLAEVEAEERQMAAEVAAGDVTLGFYWMLSLLPKELPRRIYFVWNRAVRAYHEVQSMEPGRIWMSPEIHTITPIPMAPFRGFRYFDAQNALAAAK